MNTTRPTPRTHQKQQWVDLEGIQAITGYGPSRMSYLANTDTAFPPAHWLDGTHRKAGHRQWYRLEEAQEYAAVLAQRRRAALADYDGDPDAPLPLPRAAEVWSIKPEAFRRYVYRSIPLWRAGDLEGGYVPFPIHGADDLEATTPRHWRWTARQLIDFPRPGRGKILA